MIQVFDSWVGHLSVDDYREFVAPYSARILESLDVPTIHFGTGTTHLLEDMADAGGDVIGIDWRIPIDRGWDLAGHDRGVQGNLDPTLLLGHWERVERGAHAVLDAVDGRPGHIFNLGHGVLPGDRSRRPPPDRRARARADADRGGGLRMLGRLVIDARLKRVPTRPPAHARAYRCKAHGWRTECAECVAGP